MQNGVLEVPKDHRLRSTPALFPWLIRWRWCLREAILHTNGEHAATAHSTQHTAQHSTTHNTTQHKITTKSQHTTQHNTQHTTQHTPHTTHHTPHTTPHHTTQQHTTQQTLTNINQRYSTSKFGKLFFSDSLKRKNLNGFRPCFKLSFLSHDVISFHNGSFWSGL